MEEAIKKYKERLSKVLDFEVQADTLRYYAQTEFMSALDTWATKKGIGKTELASKLGVSRTFLCDMKKQNRLLSYEVLERITKIIISPTKNK